MDILFKAGQLLLCLSILIVLHEMGHFFPAKWFKTRVDKFYLFFDAPPFNSLWKKQSGETEYGIGWLPLGGYVKIAGMVDESMDTEFKNAPPQPWEFRSKPAWQRLIIMLGGVTVNFVLGFFIMGMLLWAYGREYVPTTEIQKNYGLAFDSILLKQGFQQGDVITHLGKTPFDRFDTREFVQKVVLGSEKSVTVLRNGQSQVLTMSNDIDRQITDLGVPKSALLAPRIPFFVAGTQPDAPAAKAGLKEGDKIIGFNDTPIGYFDEFARMAQQNKNANATIKIQRGTDTLNLPMTLSAEGTIGAFVQHFSKTLQTQRETFTLAQALPLGVKDGIEFLGGQISAFGKMITGKISANKNLGSFISIGGLFPKAADFSWEQFWSLTATLSLILAFMNLLPIPALDGGYVMFLIWEVVTGRKVSDNVMEKAVTGGFFLLMGLMVYAFGLDIWRNILAKFF
jgi:regulator of sigma E protease